MDWLATMVGLLALWLSINAMKDTDSLEILSGCVRVMAIGMGVYQSANTVSVSCTIFYNYTILYVNYSVLNSLEYWHPGVLCRVLGTLLCDDSHWSYLYV